MKYDINTLTIGEYSFIKASYFCPVTNFAGVNAKGRRDFKEWTS